VERVRGIPFFENLKQYVGFTEESTAALRELRPLASSDYGWIVDDFYAAIESHPGARAAINGGEAQIARLKQTLIEWMDSMLLGPHDQAYYERRARIGRVHVRIGLPQGYMFAAMNRIRLHVLDVLRRKLTDPERAAPIAKALHQIIDLELAIMLETYREDLVAKNRNAERLATIGQFAASIGHELRNPLGVMESSLFLAQQYLGANRPPAVTKHLDRIAGEIKRSNKTIDDLLELARNRPAKRAPTAVKDLVESAAQGALLPANVSVEIATPAGLTGDIDPDQVRQVLVNLFVNASQAMNGSGHIVVEGEMAGGELRLRVRDDGPGVPADVRYRIFEALFTTKARGSGLGLALCRRIMDVHGGTIELEASEGRGASFLLTIPTLPAATAQS
jgi:signal transduction histidine kinase